MKMVKKCMIALAVAALMATTVQAGAPAPDGSIKRDGDWPWTYKAIDLCVMPIYMDVGHFVQLKDCSDRKIHLKQVTCTSIGKNNTEDFPCYRDCEEIQVRANFPAIFGGRVDKNSTGILKDTEVKWAGDKFQIIGGGDWEQLTICVNAWKAEIWRATEPSEKTQVGTLTITVKPPDGGTL
jgi:hypothetical protein